MPQQPASAEKMFPSKAYMYLQSSRLCCKSIAACLSAPFTGFFVQRCLGAKTQNASELFHSVLWSLMPNEQHSSVIAVEKALQEAVLRCNASCYRATQELPSLVGLTPGHLTNQWAADRHSVWKRLKKRMQHRQEKRQKKRAPKKTSSYCAGQF